MEKLLESFDRLKPNNNGLSVLDVIHILQNVDNSDTLETIEGISDDEMKKENRP